MITTPTQIDLWRQEPSEHQRLEFKEGLSTQLCKQPLMI